LYAFSSTAAIAVGAAASCDAVYVFNGVRVQRGTALPRFPGCWTRTDLFVPDSIGGIILVEEIEIE
jgi:hypothetical protein